MHAPVIAPLLLAVYWTVMLLLSALMAPLALIDGITKAWADASATEAAPAERAGLAIVVTGCDSGFGRSLAVALAERGYTVFAGCLSPESASSLTGIHRLRACKMDVTSDADVDSCVAAVHAWVEEGRGARRLLSVVSNAGRGAGGWVDWLSMGDYESDIAVNFLGVVRVSKSFLPLLRRSAAAAAGSPFAAPPRLLIVSSMSGKLPLANVWGVHVSTALPSFHRTPLTTGGVGVLVRKWTSLGGEARALYGDHCAESCFRIADGMMSDWAWEPERVTEALARAATSRGAPPAELNLLRHLPAAALETVIWRWYASELVPPAGASADGKGRAS
ncbi:hypothetical protein EMIHUDRAFT_310752 [Emiliania huxleyi CCMP1516]|uniref:Uncharacterized protein n=2 Tax=Emiliania huxleyi TaxID=2903 RepID=A0A0D3J2N7_EMIH1|nr:hypothetical protein EMIHUDRAFT_310752 [Emiliania huxleyi CCMP1516]EOD17772.1 hypothetical protein EMIHUDRAFT_310752 [Emiliania huxleyi CCMP1516]|eukprot:XP_005770201.1 hypothetical protein EMIHUDRAFT_310752 [Emiliania huxleyi CCMP1516]